MPRNESPSVSVSRCGHGRIGNDPRRSVVWVRGEHDIATRMNLSATIARAARIDDTDVVVDLSGVTFMDASTISALLVARDGLRACSCWLSVRDPSPRARRLLDLCGLERLLDEHPTTTPSTVATALGSWVEVPTRDGGAEAALSPAAGEAESREPAGATTPQRAEPAESVPRPRAAS